MRSIKESSDELNPPVVTTGVGITRASGGKSPRDYLALALATCGVGYLPGAPGTFGSAVGVGLYLLFRLASAQLFAFGMARGWSLELLESLRMTFMLLLVAALAFAGVWAASRTEKLLGSGLRSVRSDRPRIRPRSHFPFWAISPPLV